MEFIIKNVKVWYRYIKNEDFRKWIKNYNTPTSLDFYEGGNYYGNIIYIISLEDLKGMENDMGFFALLNCVLNRLYYADRLGFVPVVHYPQSVLYYDTDMQTITNNVFEYFFYHVSKVSYEEALKSKNIVISQEKDSQFNLCGKPGYLLSDKGVSNLAMIWKKYLKFNTETKTRLENECENLLPKNEKILGIHVRGTDFKYKNKNHPIAIDLKQYIDKTKEIIEKGKYTFVFLACDENSAVQVIKKEIDRVICFEDVLRSDNNDPIHKTEYNRKYHKYLLGYEVLRDMYALAKCDGFLAGKSQVSLAVRIYKESLQQEFSDVCILDNGMYL